MNTITSDITTEQLVLLPKDNGCLEGIIDSKKINEITIDYAFKILKIFIGEDNPNFKLLSIDSLTLIKPGIGNENSIKYVYNWGASLIQIFFYLNEKLHFSVKMIG